jgi:hypothetical protein
MPINDMNKLPERFERKYYLIPPEVGFAYGLLCQICVMDSEYPSEQINSLYFDTADLDQYVRSLSGDFEKDKVHIRKTSTSSWTANLNQLWDLDF